MSDIAEQLEKQDFSQNLQGTLLNFVRENAKLVDSYFDGMSDLDILNLYSIENFPMDNLTVIRLEGKPFISFRYSFSYDGKGLKCTFSVKVNRFWEETDEVERDKPQ